MLKRNVPHIWEKIFLSLDYASFQNCLRVSHEWNNVLESESFSAKVKSTFSVNLWSNNTDGLKRNLWKSTKNIVNWTAGNGEVAFVEKIGRSKIVHLIDSDGELRSSRLRFRVERVHDLWILRHVVLLEVESWGGFSVYSIDKLKMSECREVIQCCCDISCLLCNSLRIEALSYTLAYC